MALLDDVKAVCRVAPAVTAYNTELTDLIDSAFADLGITDISSAVLTGDDSCPALIKRAVCTYCKMNFGVFEDSVYDRLKSSYDEQKSQLLMSSDYTDWSGSDV